ncbi:MAG: mmoC [Gammaproteobacteria bacterium]|jgi:ferredoxin-NADP reductase|nr:mmoC [Gammaproteobacteria bacterium]
MQNTFTVTLVEATLLTPKVRHLKFKRHDGLPLEFTPGQFVSFHFSAAEGKEIRRSYSLASIPGQSEHIELALGYVEGGLASKTLFTAQPGDQFAMSGPYGRLILRDENPQRYIMVATSTGVTPYRSMLPALAARLNQVKVVIMLGVQTRLDALYSTDFLAYANQYPNLDFRLCYSRETDKEHLLPFEHLGYVQEQFALLNPSPDNDIVYLCGNPNMIDAAYDILKEKGFSAQQVRREKYVS